MSKKVIIVGGVAGGSSTVARLRRLDETADIIMFKKANISHLPTVDYLTILVR